MPCAAALLAGLAACGFGRIPPPDNATFETRLADGGLKFFIYRWGPLEEEHQAEPTRHHLPGDGVALPAPRFVPHHRESFEAAVEDKLAETGYCREGYYVLSRHFIPGESRLRGECKELATEQDRRRFGNQPGD